MSGQARNRSDENGISGDDRIQSASTPHISATTDDGGSLKTQKLILNYEELIAELKCGRRTAERLVSKGVIQKIPNMCPAKFYWPDVLAALRSQKGYVRHAD